MESYLGGKASYPYAGPASWVMRALHGVGPARQIDKPSKQGVRVGQLQFVWRWEMMRDLIVRYEYAQTGKEGGKFSRTQFGNAPERRQGEQIAPGAYWRGLGSCGERDNNMRRMEAKRGVQPSITVGLGLHAGFELQDQPWWDSTKILQLHYGEADNAGFSRQPLRRNWYRLHYFFTAFRCTTSCFCLGLHACSLTNSIDDWQAMISCLVRMSTQHTHFDEVAVLRHRIQMREIFRIECWQ